MYEQIIQLYSDERLKKSACRGRAMPVCLFRAGAAPHMKRFVRREGSGGPAENVLFGTLACTAASLIVLS